MWQLALQGLRGAASLASSLLLAGCAAAAPGTRDPSVVSVITGDGMTINIQRGADIRVNHAVTVSPAEVWLVLPQVYADLGVRPDILDSARRLLGVGAQRFSSRMLNRPASDFFDCGLDAGLMRPLADQVPITAQRRSTGLMEALIGQMVQKKAAPADTVRVPRRH